MTTNLTTRQFVDHLFLLTLLSSPRAERAKLMSKVLASLAEQPDGEKTYTVEVRVNGIDLDFNDFTDKVNAQLDEMIMRAARKLLDEQFADRLQSIAGKLYDAERHAKDLSNALENEVRKTWGMPMRAEDDR